MTRLSLEECQSIIRSLVGQTATDSNQLSTSGRFGPLHAKGRMREAHFFNAPEADQKLPPPFDEAEPYQSDVVRQSWVALKARYTENEPVIRIDDEDLTPSERTYANEVEAVLQEGLNLIQQRQRFQLLGEMADGPIIPCYSVLHWRKAPEVWAEFPDYDFVDERPEGEEKRYRPEPDDEDEDDAETKRPVRRKGKYRETDESRLSRDTRAKSRSFPWYIEVVRYDQFAFVEDRKAANGMAVCLVIRRVPLLDYSRKLKREGIILSVSEGGGIDIGQEKEAPASDQPSYSGFTEGDQKMVYVAQLWDRECCYELASYGGSAYTMVKDFEHPYEMPPFELVTWDEYNHPDPLRAYLPACEGLFRLKPFYDHDMTLGRQIAEQIALPFYWIKLADGSYMEENGKQIAFTRNALAAIALPSGASIEKIDFEMNPAFVQFLQQTAEELQDAAPETGTVDVGASTQPYTIKLAQEQANPPVKQGKANAARAIRGMVRNWTLVMSKSEDDGGFGRPVPLSISVDDKGKKRRKIAEVVPGARTRDLIDRIEVDINPLSAAQNVTNMEFGRQLVGDPNIPYTPRDFAEKDLQEPDPDRTVMEWDAWTLYREKVYPTLATQVLAQKFGKVFYATPDGGFVNATGAPVSPEQVLGANGVAFPQQAAPGAAGPLPPVMSPTAPLEVPGTFAESALV